MMELWYGDEFIDVIWDHEWEYWSETPGYHFKWCDGYGP